MTRDIRRLVATAPHEYTVNLNYNSDGLRPWFGCISALSSGGGSVERSFEHDGTTYETTLYYQEGNLEPPETGQTPAGTDIEFQTIREPRLDVTAVDGGRADAGFNAHVRPRWKNLTATKDDGSTVSVPVPDDLANHRTDAISVRVSGSNVDPTEYLTLLQKGFASVGVGAHYFESPHPTSNIQDVARYVRLDRDESGPVHARAGPIVGLAHVMENDREGYRKLVQNDQDNHGRTLPGFYHTATLGPERVQEVFPSHTFPVEVKHYYESEALDRSPDDALAHPKLEVSYQVSRWDDTLRPTDDTLERIRRELDETIYSVLADAGLDLRAGGPYISDEYFDAENATTDANIVSLDLSEIRHEQENIVVRHLADGLSPVERECLDALVTDGGEVSPSDVADSYDRHIDSVYRALDRMEDMIDREYDSISLRSTYVAELVHDALDAARSGMKRAVDATAKALDAADRGLDERTSEFVAWAARAGVNHKERNGSVRLDFGHVDADNPRQKVKRLLREGYRLWEAMNRDPATFKAGKWVARWEETVGPDLRSVDVQQTKTVRKGGKVWRHLPR